MTASRFMVALGLILLLAVCATPAFAQSTISGEITGVVTDASGAVVPNATLTLSSADYGTSETTKSSSTGTYRFPLLRPGTYKISVKAAGFAEATRSAVASLGSVTNLTIQLSVQAGREVVEVTAAAPLLQTDNPNLTTNYDTKQIELIPSPGQDITNYAFSAPGAFLSTGAGYGNFTAYGKPGTSNLYTVNGNDYNDPYLNLNNSGASNLLLGANELQEITITNNGYTGQYGRAAGANVNYTTKSGTNKFHGNLDWFWNGTTLNANDFFGNQSATPRPHQVSNQWAGSFGGPIKKDKLFFFYDNEGLRYVLPGGGTVAVPSAQYQSAVLANLATASPASVPFYKTIFNLYNGAPGVSRATAANTITLLGDASQGCGDFDGTLVAGVGYFGTSSNPTTTPPASSPGIPCANTYTSTVNNLNIERLMSLRVDYNATDKDKLAFRWKEDRGVQATGTDPINSAFNANSIQPEDDGQFTWTRVLNANMVNQFIASGLYYSAIFGPPNYANAIATFPTTIAFGDGDFANMGGADYNYPQGRNVTQWQIVDDFSWTRGNHGIKFGVNFRKNDVTDFSANTNHFGLVTMSSMTDFFNGVVVRDDASSLSQRFANIAQVPVSYYSMGLYFQDEWRVNSHLKLTMSLRADRNSDPICKTNCFARLATNFQALTHTATIPYNQAILSGQNQAFPSQEAIAWGPRGGFAWTPGSNQKTVIRAGMGLFSDLYPGFLSSRFITNAPNAITFAVPAPGGTAFLAPGIPGSAFTQASAVNSAFQPAFASGGTLASITAAVAAAGSSFSPPSFNSIVNNITNPKYLEWNFEIERAFGDKTSATLNYVGHHAWDIFSINGGLNGYCTPANCPTGFVNMPSARPDSRFGTITEFSNQGYANYNGLTFSLVRRFTQGFQAHFNYTWSHSLDTTSNNGTGEAYSFGSGGDSITRFIDPTSLRLHNYGSSDYDFRHIISATYIWELPFKSASRAMDLLIGGWSLSGNVFFRTGEPYSVYNSLTKLSTNGNTVLADYVGGPTSNCTWPGLTGGNKCITASQFVYSGASGAPKQFDWGNSSRNMFVGPHFFNSDFSVQKGFKITESGFKFTIGANAFNVFNHPNFANPTDSVSSGSLGKLVSTVTPPNSPYGNFQGAAVSGRVLQLDMKIRF